LAQRVRKAVFPVAGLGTRFLPATKSMPKELLPVVDKPVIHYAVDEAKAAGIEQFIFVTSRGKSAMEDHFDRAPELEATLQDRGKEEALAVLRDSVVNEGDMTFVRQGTKTCVGQLVEAHAAIGTCHMIAVQEVDREATNKYGIFDPETDASSKVFRARGMVEKPKPEDAPSNIAAIGRYVLDPVIFAHLDQKKRGAGNEIQLTDSIAQTMDTAPLYGCQFDGVRYDCGDKLGFLKANIASGLGREDLSAGLKQFMREMLDES